MNWTDSGPLDWVDIGTHAGVVFVAAAINPALGFGVATLFLLREILQRFQKKQHWTEIFTSRQVLLEWSPGLVIAIAGAIWGA